MSETESFLTSQFSLLKNYDLFFEELGIFLEIGHPTYYFKSKILSEIVPPKFLMLNDAIISCLEKHSFMVPKFFCMQFNLCAISGSQKKCVQNQKTCPNGKQLEPLHFVLYYLMGPADFIFNVFPLKVFAIKLL